MKYLINKILEVLALLIKDTIVFLSEDYVNYTVQGKYLIYKWDLPFNLSLGSYRFIKEKEYNTIV